MNRIHCVCQDERDLNCFAYTSQDGARHFCHVFSVLTGVSSLLTTPTTVYLVRTSIRTVSASCVE